MTYDYDDQDQPTYCSTCGTRNRSRDARFCPNLRGSVTDPRGSGGSKHYAPGMALWGRAGLWWGGPCPQLPGVGNSGYHLLLPADRHRGNSVCRTG